MDSDRPMLLRHDNTLFMSQNRMPVETARVTGDDIYQARKYVDELEVENKRMCAYREEQYAAVRLRLRAVEALAWLVVGQVCPHHDKECGKRWVRERIFTPVKCVMCLVHYGMQTAREKIGVSALCEEVTDCYWEAMREAMVPRAMVPRAALEWLAGISEGCAQVSPCPANKPLSDANKEALCRECLVQAALKAAEEASDE